MLVFTALLQLMSVMDACAVDSVHLLNLIYLPLVIFQVVKIMDTKQAKLANSFFLYVAFLFTLAGLYIHLSAHVIASKSIIAEQPSYPLWKPKPEPLVFFGPEEEPMTRL